MAASSVFDPTANSFENEIVPRNQRRETRGPSKGCEKCRARKIKCDEKRPVCSRCDVHDFSCKYRDYSLQIFRDETTHAANKVFKRVQAKQHERRELALTLGLGIPKSVSPSVQQAAVTRFFHDFVIDGAPTSPYSHRGGGYYALIPEIYRRSKPQSCFAMALSAAANANFWRRHKSSQAQVNGLRDCGKALHQLRKDLQRCSKMHITHDMLVASHLLAMYQLVVSHDSSQRKSWTAHVNGAVALLELEDQNDPQRRELTGILHNVVSQMLIDCLVLGRHPTLSLERCTSVMAPADMPAPALLGFMYRTAELCATWKNKYSADRFLSAQRNFDIDEFLDQCQTVDEQVEDWMQNRLEVEASVILPNTKQNVRVPTLWPLFAASGAPTTLRLYADIHQTYQWQYYRACQLTLLRTMIAAVGIAGALATTDAALAEYDLVKARLHSRTIGLVDDVLSTVFSTLSVSISGKAQPESVTDIEGIRGLQLLWPLHTAGACLINIGQYVPNGSEKLAWVRMLFQYIRDDLGIQIANNFRGAPPSYS